MKDQKKENRLWSGDFKLKVVLDIIENSDAIFYLEAGKIIEKGTNEQLLSYMGKYKKMYYAYKSREVGDSDEDYFN